MLGNDPVGSPDTTSPADSSQSAETSTSHEEESIVEAEQSESNSNSEQTSKEVSSSEPTNSSDKADDLSVLCKKTICMKHRDQEACEKTKRPRCMGCKKYAQESAKTSTGGDTSQNPTDDSLTDARRPAKETKKPRASKTESTSHSEPSSKTNETTQTSESDAPASKNNSSGPEKQDIGADKSGWSLSEDHQLRGMKEATRDPMLTWAEIGKALRRGKKECQARWKEIKDQPHRVDSDEGRQSVENESPTKDAPGKGKDKSAGKSESKWHNGERNTKVAAENKTARTRAASKATTPAILSGEEPSTDSDPDSDSDHDDLGYGPCDERRRQACYLHRHIYSGLYPAAIDVQPDELFGPRDCEVLAAVDSKYKCSKWLEMQANFYNVTGRMVPLDVIRDKCERADAESSHRRQENKTPRDEAERRKKVERWVGDIDQEHLDDPES